MRESIRVTFHDLHSKSILYNLAQHGLIQEEQWNNT